MNQSLKQSRHNLSAIKITLYTVACLTIFIAVSLICNLLTTAITIIPLRAAVREIVLRAPLIILALHFFASKVIRTYDPCVIYGKFNLRTFLKWLAFSFMLPATVGIAYYLLKIIVPFQQSVPPGLDKIIKLIVTWSSISIAAGLTEEVLFRGHLFTIISSQFSKAKSILITSFIFGLVHIVMLPAFGMVDVITVIAGGTIAGLMFSLIYLYSGGIWYAALVHIVWDIFFIGKITAIATTSYEANQIVMPFRLTIHNSLLTGGNFGIEAGLPCFIIYILVILVIYILINKNKMK